MRTMIVAGFAGLMALSAPAFAQTTSSGSGAAMHPNGDAAQEAPKGSMNGMTEGRASAPEGSTTGRTGTLSETVPNGNAAGKQKSGANGS